MGGGGRGGAQFGQNRLGQLLAEFDPHWSKELIPQMIPCTKILCS